MNSSGIARLVDANVRFTRPDIQGQETLLAVVYVQRLAEAGSDDQIERQLVRAIRSSLQANESGATPLVDVTLLEE